MFRIDYTDLSYNQVRSIVGNGKAPEIFGEPLSLTGEKLCFILDDEGICPPQVSYEFINNRELILKENGEEHCCAYGALALQQTVLFAHWIPGTLRGYAAVIDWESGSAVLEEMWFIDEQGQTIDTTEQCLSITELSQIGFFVNREVERQIYRGCVLRENGKASEVRFEKGLRLDNKMIFWEDEIGRRRVFTYISNYFSTMVEVGMPDGEDVLSLPSDYLEISDNLFFYSIGEVEYSGRLSVEVLDLFSMRKIGVTVGIDENDEFEFRIYSAKGRYLGQYATFFDFDDLGRSASGNMASRLGTPTKGARGTYRTSILAKKMTDEEMIALSQKEIPLFDVSENNGMITDCLKMRDSKECAGRKVIFRDDDGYQAEFDFLTDTRLRFREKDGEFAEQEYRASQLDEKLVFLGFHIAGSVPAACVIAALDFENGCATLLSGRVGGGHEPHDVVNTYHFGYIVTDGTPVPRTRRHSFTRELLGRSFTWAYSKGVTSQHIYNAPNSYSWTIFSASPVGRGRGGFVWSAPCTYIKLRENVYMMTWVEEKWSGTMTSVAMNLRTMHDTGFFLYIDHDGSRIGFNQLSAFARDAGRCDMDGIYEL